MKRELKFLDRNLLKNGDTYDKPLLWVLLCLLAFGLVMVYSTTGATAVSQGHYAERMTMVSKQGQFILLGLMTAYLASYVPMWRWMRWTKLLVPLSLASLILLYFIGQKVNGATRWLSLLGFNFQPSELFKLVTILYMASFFKRHKERLANLKTAWFLASMIGFGIGLIVFSRDLGSAAVVAVIFIALLFLTNFSFKSIIYIAFFAILGGAVMIILEPFRVQRLLVAFKPWDDPLGTGFQSMGALMSSHHGSWFGQGLGNAVIKRGFLPESHNDFILAVIAEEFGWIRLLCLLGIYLWLIVRAFSIGKIARDLELYFNSFVAFGIAVWVSVQSLINSAVNITLFPNKGLTLPLISYGGSSLIVMMIAFTMLLRVDYENRLKMRGYHQKVQDPKELENLK